MPLDYGEAFAIPDFWRASDLIVPLNGNDLDEQQLQKCTEQDTSLISKWQHAATPVVPVLKLELPRLEDFTFGLVESISAPESVVDSVELEEKHASENDDFDVWALDLGGDPESEAPLLATWDCFKDPNFAEEHVFLSEAPQSVYDAFLRRYQSMTGGDLAALVVKPDPFIQCLRMLALGRTSLFFGYDGSSGSFVRLQPDIKISGFSDGIITDISNACLGIGHNIHTLRTFVQDAYNQSTPRLIAIAAAFSTISEVIETFINTESESINSLIGLSSILRQPQQILRVSNDMIGGLHRQDSQWDTLSKIHRFCEALDASDPWTRSILRPLLALSAKLYTDHLGSALGIGSTNTYFGFRSLGFDHMSCVPLLFEEEIECVKEASEGLDLIRAHLPNHSLMSLQEVNITVPSLEWKFDWSDLERIQAKADAYEYDLYKALDKTTTNTCDHGQDPELNETWQPTIYDTHADQLPALLTTSQIAFEKDLESQHYHRGHTELIAGVSKTLHGMHDQVNDGSLLDPPLSITASMSFGPIIKAQARMINFTCLRMLFEQHELQYHISLQRRFVLLGDGVFSSRLSHALFDPELPSSQRRKGRVRSGTVGLNVGFRDDWPPASSELRLALTGILRESFQDSHSNAISENEDLPGGLSFAIRALSDTEIDKCLDPDSLEALDFLQIQYKSASPLDTIITSSCLEKYDQMSKLLLRMSRMVFVTDRLFRERKGNVATTPTKEYLVAQRFSIDAHHFIAAVNAYFQDDTIAPIWHSLEDDLRRIALRLTTTSTRCPVSEHDSIGQLQRLHEWYLDQMLSALLLRQRQQKALGMLEATFSIILQFCKFQTTPGSSVGPSIHSQYRELRNTIASFIDACRELGLRKGPAASRANDGTVSELFNAKSSAGEANTLNCLLLRLEMNGHYGKPV
ncbi:hypothetical protein MMC25_001964 [Agyrium rufum]|nr:hypothetical protein [Agyrium rufum]